MNVAVHFDHMSVCVEDISNVKVNLEVEPLPVFLLENNIGTADNKGVGIESQHDDGCLPFELYLYRAELKFNRQEYNCSFNYAENSNNDLDNFEDKNNVTKLLPRSTEKVDVINLSTASSGSNRGRSSSVFRTSFTLRTSGKTDSTYLDQEIDLFCTEVKLSLGFKRPGNATRLDKETKSDVIVEIAEPPSILPGIVKKRSRSVPSIGAQNDDNTTKTYGHVTITPMPKPLEIVGCTTSSVVLLGVPNLVELNLRVLSALVPSANTIVHQAKEEKKSELVLVPTSGKLHHQVWMGLEILDTTEIAIATTEVNSDSLLQQERTSKKNKVKNNTFDKPFPPVAHSPLSRYIRSKIALIVLSYQCNIAHVHKCLILSCP